jgi:hypothetical protein
VRTSHFMLHFKNLSSSVSHWTHKFPTLITGDHSCCLLALTGVALVLLWAGMCLLGGWPLLVLRSCIWTKLATFAGSVSITPVPDSLKAWLSALWNFILPMISACICFSCLLRKFAVLCVLFASYIYMIDILVKTVFKVESVELLYLCCFID